MTSPRLYRLPAVVAFVLTLLSASAFAQSGATVVGSGGGHAADATVRLNGTVGQYIVGRVSQGSTGASQGFWRPPAAPQNGSRVTSPTTGDAVIAFTATPNPVTQFSELSAGNLAPGRVTIDLYDAAGAHIATLLDEIRPGGRVAVRVDGTELPSGNYTAILVNGGTRRSLILRVTK